MKNLSVCINLVSAFLLNVLANIIINKRNQGETMQNYDIIQANTVDLSDYRNFADYMLYGIIAFAIYNYNKLPVYTIIKLLTVFLIMRSVSVSVTSLHDCNKKRENKCQFTTSRAFTTGGCEDKMFSGHTIVTLILCYYLARAFGNTYAANVLFGAYAVTLSILSIVVRNHYTIDVLTAWVLFYFYHSK